MALITCRDASFAYEGNIVLNGLNFQVEQGDYLCIVGENGSGKTTLMKGLLGLMRPKTGSIEWGGGLKSTQIGYLPQQSAAQKNFPVSVYEVVLSGRLGARAWRPFYSRFDRQIALENMEKLRVSSLRSKPFRTLSGGQQQRVLLARALCATDKILLLDEPVSGLDPIATAELYQEIQTLHQDSACTIIMISHDVRAGAEHATHILHLQNRQLFFGAADLYRQSEIGQHYLGGAFS